MIFEALQSDLLRFKFHSLGSRILKFPEFNLLMEYFRRLNNQNRLSVTDSTMSINSTTSTETPSTVRAVTSGDQEDLSKSQEDLLANDNASVASGNR